MVSYLFGVIENGDKLDTLLLELKCIASRTKWITRSLGILSKKHLTIPIY